MAFDFRKEYKELYKPGKKPEIVQVGPMNFLAIRGVGDPNEENGDYAQALQIFYSLAYCLKMSYKTDYAIEGFYEYVVPPLEGFWWSPAGGVDYSRKEDFHWISVIRLPEFITRKDFDWAVQTTTKKKKLPCCLAEFLTIEEGLCVQVMHTGSYDEEPATIARMNAWLEEHGYENNMSGRRHHHEIYLSDPRKTDPEKLKTIIRHPIRKKEQ